MDATDKYAGDEGMKRKVQDEQLSSGRVRSDAQDARRDLVARVPYGRALDVEDLATMCDEGTQSNRGLVMRRLLLAEIRKNLPAGILITRDELEQLRADSIAHPTRPGPCAKVAPWPAAR